MFIVSCLTNKYLTVGKYIYKDAEKSQSSKLMCNFNGSCYECSFHSQLFRNEINRISRNSRGFQSLIVI